MIVDLHIHTNRSSYCSGLSPDEMFSRAKELGLDAIAVTEHTSHRGAQISFEIGQEIGFKVFRGVEVYTNAGDIIVFGSKAEMKPDMDFWELKEIVDGDEGVMISAHPTRGWWGHHRKYRGNVPGEIFKHVVAIETFNAGNYREVNYEALKLANEVNLPGIGGSDAHRMDQVGKCVTIFEEHIEDEAGLVEALRGGNFYGMYLDELRRLIDEGADPIEHLSSILA